MANYAKYTWTLNDLVENEGVTLFDFDYVLPALVDKQELELSFYKRYYFREIGSETIERWLLQLQFKWQALAKKYYRLFEIFNEEYLANDVLTNNDLSTTYRQVFSDTPQSSLDTMTDYATNITENSTKLSGANGEFKFRLLSEYASKLRHIACEMISECESLFIQLF